MSRIPFVKYHGTGNDFILLDQREKTWLTPTAEEEIRTMCTRHFGIGADGLIILRPHAEADFEMLYFNADGRPGSMCGNGGRCAAAHAYRLGWVGETCLFQGPDGVHRAHIREGGAWVDLKMGDVDAIEQGEDYFFLDTGSPHHVVFLERLDGLDVVAAGRAIRNSRRYVREGTNVNFVAPADAGIQLATYERGVEDETLSCGTGVTASALAYALRAPGRGRSPLKVEARGGTLEVRFRREGLAFRDVWLSGPAQAVFEGHWTTRSY